MRPPPNSFPRQFRSKAPLRPPPPNNQLQANPPPQNPPNLGQNSMPIPAQNGMFNPQVPIFGNTNFQPFVNQAAFSNPPQQGVPQFGSMVPNMGFAPQFGFPPVQGQFGNQIQNVNQLNNALLQAQFMPNLLNLAQQLSQNMALQGQQLFYQNQMQNMGQFVPNQAPNPSQFGPHVVPPRPNPIPLGNMQSNQMEPGSPNKLNGVDVNVNAQTLSPGGALPVQAASSSTPWQNQNLQPSDFRRPQGNHNFKNSQGKNGGRKASWGLQKSQFHQGNNGKGKSRFANEQNDKGQGFDRAAKISCAEPKRSLVLTYTEKEIKQWLEERRKNYPTKATLDKKLSGKIADAETAKARREQLKEILAKQAELGVEVAEIPSSYLLDSEKKMQGEERETGGKFQKKRNRRGRFDKNKKQRLTGDNAPNAPPLKKKKKPTLLEKLLSVDIRRDQSRLLQVFRFMVTNSFLQDWPEKPLKFPPVTIKEVGHEINVAEENSNTVVEEDDDDNNDLTQANQAAVFVKENANIQVIDANEEEEEGEIID